MADEAERQEGEVRLLPSGKVVGRMTWDEFLEWCDEDTHAEWVAGEVVVHSPVNDRHQDLCGFLEAVLRIYAESRRLGVVRSGPFQMKIGEVSRQPDVMFIAAEHRDRIKELYLDGPADLVVEIVSPDSVGRDRGEKYYEYESAGVPEYWLIDPQRQQAEFYQLGDDGRYRLVQPDAEGRYWSSVLPEFWVRVDWLWADSLPPVEEVLFEIGGRTYAERWIERLRQAGYLEGDRR